MRLRELVLAAMAAIGLFGLSSQASADPGWKGGHHDNGRHLGWYKHGGPGFGARDGGLRVVSYGYRPAAYRYRPAYGYRTVAYRHRYAYGPRHHWRRHGYWHRRHHVRHYGWYRGRHHGWRHHGWRHRGWGHHGRRHIRFR